MMCIIMLCFVQMSMILKFGQEKSAFQNLTQFDLMEPGFIEFVVKAIKVVRNLARAERMFLQILLTRQSKEYFPPVNSFLYTL